MPFEQGDSLSEKRHGAASMGEYEPNLGTTPERTRKNQIHDGARGIKNVLDDERRCTQAGFRTRFAMGRVNKHHSASPVELVEDRVEQRVTKVAVVDAGKKPDTIQTQDIEGVIDFCQRTI